MTDLVVVRRAVIAAEEIVASVFDLARTPVAKVARRSGINTAKGFDALVIGTLRELRTAISGDQKRAIEGFLTRLEADWGSMSVSGRRAWIDSAARDWLAVSRGIPVKVGSTLLARGKTIVQQAKWAEQQTHGLRIDPSFSLADEEAIRVAANHQALYIRNEQGKRAADLSDIARNVVADGISRGLDKDDLAKELKKTLAETSANKAENYLRMIASVFVARARSYATLSAYDEAGFESFAFEAMMDEVTSETCRFMHGKTFSVAKALTGYKEVAASDDPEAVKDIQPWVNSGRNSDGERILYYNEGNQRRLVAKVDTPGVGKKDAAGSYSSAMSPKQLEGAGISAPPLHGYCRSTIVPVGTSMVSVPRAPAAAPVPTPARAVAPIVQPVVAPAPVVQPQPTRTRPAVPVVAPIVQPTPAPVLAPIVPGAPVQRPEPPFGRVPSLSSNRDREGFALWRLGRLPRYNYGEGSAGDVDAIVNPIPSFTTELNAYAKPPWPAKKQTRLAEESERLRALEARGAGPAPKNIRVDQLKSMTPDLMRANVRTGAAEEFRARAGDIPIVVRSGGQLYVYENVERVAAAHLGMRKTIKAHVIDLDAAPARRPARPAAPVRVPPTVGAPVRPATTPEAQPAGQPGKSPVKIPLVYTKAADFGRRFMADDPKSVEGIKKVFGSDRVPSVHSLEQVWGSKEAGHRVKIDSVRVRSWTDYETKKPAYQVTLDGHILNDKGEVIGPMGRSFTRHGSGRFEVHHDLFKIEDKKELKKKTGRTMMRQAIQTYKELGANDLTVGTAWIGRYAWATFGYNWNAAAVPDIRERLTHYLRSKGVAATNAEKLARKASTHAWEVAALDVDGIVVEADVDVGRDEKERMKMHVGKAFMLETGPYSGRSWSGKIVLDDDTHETYQAARRKTGL